MNSASEGSYRFGIGRLFIEGLSFGGPSWVEVGVPRLLSDIESVMPKLEPITLTGTGTIKISSRAYEHFFVRPYLSKRAFRRWRGRQRSMQK